SDKTGEVTETVRQDGPRRTADAGRIEGDRLDPVQRGDKRLDQFDARSDSVAQQQRRPFAVSGSNADPQALSADIDGADLNRWFFGLHQRPFPNSGFKDVSPRRGVSLRILLIPQLFRRVAAFARARDDPISPMIPPGA